MGSQRVGHDWATELDWIELNAAYTAYIDSGLCSIPPPSPEPRLTEALPFGFLHTQSKMKRTWNLTKWLFSTCTKLTNVISAHLSGPCIISSVGNVPLPCAENGGELDITEGRRNVHHTSYGSPVLTTLLLFSRFICFTLSIQNRM